MPIIDFYNYEIEIPTLKLIKFSVEMDTSFAGQELIKHFTNEEIKFVEYLNRFLPNRSEQESDKNYWDIILTDYHISFIIENILVKYNVKYDIEDLTEHYYKKSKKIESSLIYEINLFIDGILTIDYVLDRINEVGINNLTKFELSFLERQSKNLTNQS